MAGLSWCKAVGYGVLLVAVATTSAQANTQGAVPTAAVQQALKQSSIPFIKNQGQKHSDVAFYTRTPGGALFVDKQGGLVYALRDDKQAWAFKESFVSDKALKPREAVKSALPLRLQDSQGMRTLVTAERVSLGEIASGIRVELQAASNNVEKLFYIAPGAAPQKIQVRLAGIQASHVDAQGRLVIDTGLGPVAFSKPVAFQWDGHEKQFVDVAYVLKDNVYGFALGDYDTARELVIDPVLAATYLGGGDGYPTYSYDDLTSLVVDGDYIYAAGGTHSPDFPTALGYDSTFNDIRDGFVVRMTADLSTLVNATFIGGTVYDMERDSNGEIIVAGQAYSGFPKTADAYSYPSDYEQTGGFIARFNADLTQLLSAGVVVPAIIQQISMGNGRIYFSGAHNQENLAVTPGAFSSSCYCIKQGSFGANTFTGYMGSVSTDLTSLMALSWIGGSAPNDIAVSPDSSVYVITGAYTISDGAIRQFDADITSVLASQSFAYLGNDQTYFQSMLLADDFVLVSGSTRKNNLPTTPGAYDSTCGTDGNCDDTDPNFYIAKADGFLVRYSLDLQDIQGLTYFGGSGHDSIRDMVLDGAGNVLFSGIAGTGGVPTTANAEQKKAGNRFIAKMSSDLTTLIYSTYIAVDGELTPGAGSDIYLTGSIGSSDPLPVTSGAFDTTYNGGATDGYIVLYRLADGTGGGTGSGTGGSDPTPGANVAPTANAGADQTVTQKTTVTLDGSASGDSDGRVVSYQWRQLKGSSVTLANATSAVTSFTAPRTRRGRTLTLVFELTVTDNGGASSTDQVTVTVTP